MVTIRPSSLVVRTVRRTRAFHCFFSLSTEATVSAARCGRGDRGHRSLQRLLPAGRAWRWRRLTLLLHRARHRRTLLDVAHHLDRLILLSLEFRPRVADFALDP